MITKITPSETVFMVAGSGRVLDKDPNFFFIVFQGKVPNWHKIVVPQLRRTVRTLTGKSIDSWLLPSGMGIVGFEGNEDAPDIHLQHDLKRDPSDTHRRKWMVWDGDEFVDNDEKETK